MIQNIAKTYTFGFWLCFYQGKFLVCSMLKEAGKNVHTYNISNVHKMFTGGNIYDAGWEFLPCSWWYRGGNSEAGQKLLLLGGN